MSTAFINEIKNECPYSQFEPLVMCQPQSIATNEDCMDVMKRYPDKFFALAIVDPPYGIGWSAKAVSHTGNSAHSKTGKIGLVIGHNFKPKQWDDAIPDQNYFDELFRVSKHQIIFGENYLDFAQKKTSSGRIIWDKVNGDTTFSDCEIAWTSLFSSVREVEYMWNGMMQGKSITEGRTPQANKRKNEKKIHLTQKPVLLYDWILSTCAEKGWNILDTHLGSGSSRIACHKAGLEFLGCETDIDHFNDEEKRWNEYLLQLPMQFAGT